MVFLVEVWETKNICLHALTVFSNICQETILRPLKFKMCHKQNNYILCTMTHTLIYCTFTKKSIWLQLEKFKMWPPRSPMDLRPQVPSWEELSRPRPGDMFNEVCNTNLDVWHILFLICVALDSSSLVVTALYFVGRLQAMELQNIPLEEYNSATSPRAIPGHESSDKE